MSTKNKSLQDKKHSYEICAADLMPTDEYSRTILASRAMQIAKYDGVKTNNEHMVDFIRFYLGNNTYYGIPYSNILEVMDDVKITKLPCSHEYIAGVINRLGTLLVILNLKNILQNKKQENASTNNYIIVVKANNISVGILVDNIDDSDMYDEEILNTILPYDGVIDTKYFLGLYQGKIPILNIEALISDIQRVLGKEQGELS